MKCKDLPNEFIIDKKVSLFEAGKYATSNQTHENTYSYYHEKDKQKNNPHFTVTGTDKGKNEFVEFHITVPVSNNGGKTTTPCHFFYKYNGSSLKHTLSNKMELKNKGYEVDHANPLHINKVAELFWNTVNKSGAEE